ncbi:MAG: hypothetical protein RLZZ171_1793, partial [Cyanobacteriota bacterium]
DQGQFDSNWSDFSPSEASLPPAAISENQIAEPIGESLPISKPSKSIKPLIFVLVLSAIIGLFTYKLLQDPSTPDRDSTPPLPRPSETDTQP